MPRVIGLTILDRLGVTWFLHLPVVAFAVSSHPRVRLAPTYSFVMTRDFGAPPDDLEQRGRVRAPLGCWRANGTSVYAARYAPLLGPPRPGTRVQLVPGVNHMGLITRPEAVAAIVATLQTPDR